MCDKTRNLGPYGAHQVWHDLISGPTELTESDMLFLLFSFFFVAAVLRLCWRFLSGLLLSNSPSPTRSRLEQVILTIGNGLPLRPVLVLPTWPGMPHRVNTWGCHAEQWVYPSNDTGANGQASKSSTEWTGGVNLPEQSMTDWGALSHSMPGMWWKTSSGHCESESVVTYQLSLFPVPVILKL